MASLTPSDRQALAAAIATFRAQHPELAPQIAVWSGLAERRLEQELAGAGDALAAMGRSATVKLLAEVAVLDVAMAWQRAIQQRALVPGNSAAR